MCCDGVKEVKRGEFAAFRLKGGITAFEHRCKLAAKWALKGVLPQRLDEKEILESESDEPGH